MAGKSTVAQLNVLLSLDSSRMSRGIREAQGRISVFSKAGGKAMASFGNIAAGAMAGVALAAGAAVKKSATAAYEFNKITTKMITQIGLSRSEVRGMEKDLIRLSTAYGVAANDVAQAMWTIQSGNLRGKKAMEALEAATKLASIGMGDVNSNAQTLTSTLNAYSKSGLTAARAANIIADTVKYGQVPAEDMSEVMGDLVDLSSALDIEFSQLGGTIAALSQTTTNSSKITTQFKNIMTQIIKPSAEAEASMEDLHYSFGQLRALIEKGGLLAGLMKIKELMGDNAKVIAGELFPNVRGLTGILSALGDGWEKNAEIIDEVGKNTNSLNEAVKELNMSYSKQVDLLKNDWNNAFLNVGKAMQNSNKGVVVGFRKIVAYIPKMYNVVGKALTEFINYFIELYNKSLAFRAVIEILVGLFKSLWIIVKEVAHVIVNILANALNALFDPLNAKTYFTKIRQEFLKSSKEMEDALAGVWKGAAGRTLIGNKEKLTFTEAEDIVQTEAGSTPSGSSPIGERLGISAKARADMALYFDTLTSKLRGTMDVTKKTLEPVENVTRFFKEVVGEDGLKRLQQFGVLLAGAFEGMFDSIQNGESVWKSFGQMILGVTKKLLAAAAAAAILAALTGGASAGGIGFVQRFKEIFNGMFSIESLALGRATGGRVSAGTPYMVGERGKEMFVPDHSGKIVPHGRTQGQYGGGGDSIVVEGYISGQNILLSNKRTSRYNSRYGS